MALLITIIYLSLLLFTILFQIGLVAGRPWGEWTMGGYNKGALPYRLRIGAVTSILMLILIGLVIIDKINLFEINLDFPNWYGLGIIAFNILGVIANTITRSQKERKLWQPITTVMLICSLLLFI